MKGIIIASLVQKLNHSAEFDWMVGFMSCIKLPIYYLNNQNCHEFLGQIFFKEKLEIFRVLYVHGIILNKTA